MPEVSPGISFVVIGFNEGAHLPACLASVRTAAATVPPAELIYVDGGSSDGSREAAEAFGVDLALGGEQRRRAAENRNLGWRAARGPFVQFVDGDMALDAGWPAAALAVLEAWPDVAVVFGQLQERNNNAFYQELQVEWRYAEGEALYCGGAALFRRSALEAAGGFPEEVEFGEEPLLCWRLRNEHGLKVYHLHRNMADHDLADRGVRDYWRRNVRVGQTYAEIATLLKDSREPFWRRERRQALVFGGAFLLGVALLLLGPWPVRGAMVLSLAALLLRKTVQTLRAGARLPVALIYAAHTYFAKLGIAWGILRWRPRR